jgi:hypothetical protein
MRQVAREAVAANFQLLDALMANAFRNSEVVGYDLSAT